MVVSPPAAKKSGVRIIAQPIIGTAGPRPETRMASAVRSVLGEGGSIAAKFPGYKVRHGQLDLSTMAGECIEDGAHGLGQAGTGVGKSFAYLVPAILSGRQTIVAVPTIALQDQLVQKDLPFLASDGVMPRRFTYALLKGRRNYACNLKAERFLSEPSFERPEDADVLPAVAEWYKATTDGDLGTLSVQLPMAVRDEITTDSEGCLGDACPAASRCFTDAAKARAGAADIIVTNYAYLMLDLRLRKETGDIVTLLPDTAGLLILDEVHRLREQAVNAFTEEVTYFRWLAVSKQIKRLARLAGDLAEGEGLDGSEHEAWSDAAEAIDGEFRAMLEDFAARIEENNGDAFRLGDEIITAQSALVAMWQLVKRMTDATPAVLTGEDRQRWTQVRDRLAKLVADVWTIVRPRAELDIVRFVKLEGETGKRHVVMSATPVDVAPFLRDSLWAGKIAPTVVSVSATIAVDGSFAYFRETVGLDNCREILVDSPFNYRRDTLLYVPADSAAFDASAARKNGKQSQEWREYLETIANEYDALIRLSKGGAFALFTSREVMDYVYRRIAASLPFRVMRQGEKSLPEMVADFKADGNAVFFGVASLWEGVDVSGDALRLVIINGVPFVPPTDPVYAARCEAVRMRYGRGADFEKIAIPEASVKLQQGFGRGKRTEADRAVVAILAGGLRSKGYGVRILASLPPAPLTGDRKDVAAFFA